MAEGPADQPQRTELAALISISYSPFFRELFESVGPFGVDWGENPPDFVLTSGSSSSSLEVTQITTPLTSVMNRLPHREGAITFSLRAKQVSRKQVAEMAVGHFPEEMPYHFENAADIDTDYFKQSGEVIARKVTKLSSYGFRYMRRFLLIYDKLTSVPWERRKQGLSAQLNATREVGAFDAVLVTNGNAYPGNHFIKL